MNKNPLNLTNCEWLKLDQLRNSTIFITGGTGLVGFSLLHELTKVSDSLNLRILALVRNKEKASKKFAEFLNHVTLVVGDVLDEITVKEPIHYIIHGASVTSSQTFVEMPVETIMTAVMGTKNVLELARKKNVRSVVYLSSMESYGSPKEEKTLTEDDVGYLNPLNLRSSYPESKRLCENLCVSYCKEYGVNVKIARLVQTFGPGIPANDRRVVVQFIQSALSKENIEIKASGESSRMYLYTFDATTALLTLLLNGAAGVAYNIANKESYCSIKNLAETIIQLFNSPAKVYTNTGSEEERKIYPPDSFLYLDVSKIEALGWRPCFSLKEGLISLAHSMEELK